MNSIMEIQYIFHKGKQKKLYYCAECKFESIHAAAYKAHIHTNKHIYMLTGDSNYQPPVILTTKNQTIKRITEENKKLKEENEKLKNRVTLFEEEIPKTIEITRKGIEEIQERERFYKKICERLFELYEKK